MDKSELLKLLDDKDVIAKLREVLFTNNELKATEIVKIRNIKKFWGLNDQDPTISKIINVALKKHGEKELLSVLGRAKNSPLNKEGEMMFEYLSNIGWCLRDSNFKKIKDGKYDEPWKKKKRDQSGNKPNGRDDSEKLRKLMK